MLSWEEISFVRAKWTQKDIVLIFCVHNSDDANVSDPERSDRGAVSLPRGAQRAAARTLSPHGQQVTRRDEVQRAPATLLLHSRWTCGFEHEDAGPQRHGRKGLSLPVFSLSLRTIFVNLELLEHRSMKVQFIRGAVKISKSFDRIFSDFAFCLRLTLSKLSVSTEKGKSTWNCRALEGRA